MEMQQQVRTAISIRRFEDRDYEGVVTVSNAAFPDRPTTAEEWRYEDEHFDKKFTNERFIAEDASGTLMSYAGLWHVPWAFHPRKFGADVVVHPDARRRGIGSALWERLEARLREHQAISVKIRAWEKMPEATAFVQRRGCREVLRAWESRLDVAAFDFARLGPAVDRALVHGVTVTTLAAERAKSIENLSRIHAMEAEIAEDVPRPADEVHTPIEYDQWLGWMVNAPWAIPDAFFLAVADGEYVGLSGLFKPQTGDWLNQGLTGVRRECRGRHIATALKVKTVEYARNHGIREIRTWNEINNAPMLAINVNFGFVRQPAWITFAKEFSRSTP